MFFGRYAKALSLGAELLILSLFVDSVDNFGKRCEKSFHPFLYFG